MELHGPLLIGGQDIEVPPGAHIFEVRLAGATLALQRVEVAAGQTAQIELVRGAIASGNGVATTSGAQTESGALAPGNHALPTGEFMDYYEITRAAGQSVHLELTSPAFDTF